MNELIYCPMCELDHEDDTMCQVPDPSAVQIRLEDIRGE